MAASKDELLFVTAANNLEVLEKRLLASPCLCQGGWPIVLGWNQKSAAQLFNAVLDSRPAQSWVIWVHQDVFLPEGWDQVFLEELNNLSRQSAGVEASKLGVVGVYGVAGSGEQATRAGYVMDRGHWLCETMSLPCRVDSLDELLFAVPSKSMLRLDADLLFDFYATDLVLQGQSYGLESYVVKAPCEHWADTPQRFPISESLVQRILRSAEVFECKWEKRLPVVTPCFNITRKGAVRELATSFLSSS
jgi:hypothetical protein